MSVEALSWAWQQDVPHGEKIILLAIANHANGSGVAFVGQRRLGEMCGMAERSVRRIEERLQDRGLLGKKRRHRPNGSRTSDWLVLGGGDRAPMAALDAYPDESCENPHSRAPDTMTSGPLGPDHNRQYLSQQGKGQGVRSFNGLAKDEEGKEPYGLPTPKLERPKFDGCRTNEALWRLTCAILEEFNRQAGTRFAAVTGRGAMSEYGKRIYGRVREEPAMTLEDHATVIRDVLASRWWDGPVHPGHVYSPVPFERGRNGANGRSVPAGRAGVDQRVADLMAEARALEAQGL